MLTKLWANDDSTLRSQMMKVQTNALPWCMMMAWTIALSFYSTLISKMIRWCSWERTFELVISPSWLAALGWPFSSSHATNVHWDSLELPFTNDCPAVTLECGFHHLFILSVMVILPWSLWSLWSLCHYLMVLNGYSRSSIDSHRSTRIVLQSWNN